MPKLDHTKARELIALVQKAMHQAHTIGFHATGHVLHDAVRKVGWEYADMIEKHEKAKETP